MEFYSVLSRPPAQSHLLAATTRPEWLDHAALPNHSACNDPIASVPLASPASPAVGTVMALAELRSAVPAPLAPEMRAQRALPSEPDSGLARLAREAAYERDALVLALHAKAFRHSAKRCGALICVCFAFLRSALTSSVPFATQRPLARALRPLEDKPNRYSMYSTGRSAPHEGGRACCAAGRRSKRRT